MKKYVHLPLQTYCKRLEDLFQKARGETNPALYLYKINARGPLFMAESLTRLLGRALKSEKIAKSNIPIKEMEDILGKIDDYDTLIKEFKKNKAIKKEQINYFVTKRDKKIKKLNKKLKKNHFYGNLFNALQDEFKINFNDKAFILKLRDQLEKEIGQCVDFFMQYPVKFTSMENEVHEVRRKLRWISIYGESFGGLVVLKEDKTKYNWEKKFIKKSELSSPYNKLPVNRNLHYYIKFKKKAFVALNSVITGLGKIKDDGLKMEALAKSLQKSLRGSYSDSTLLAIKQLKLKYTEEDLLKKAHVLLNDFFIKYHIHQLLISKK